MRVSVITNLPAPYRVEILRHAASSLSYLRAHFHEATEPLRTWTTAPLLPYPYTVLERAALQVGSRRVGFYPRLTRALIEDRPDVVVSYGFSIATLTCTVFCRQRSIPLVLANDGTAFTDPTRGIEAQYRKLLVRQAAGFIAASRYAAKYFEVLGADPGRITVVRLTTDLHAFQAKASVSRQAPSQQPGHQGAHPSVALVGRLIESKRIPEALQVFERLAVRVPDVTLRIAGDGPLLPFVRAWAACRPALRVEFLGLVPDELMADVYRSSRALLFPAERERYGMVVLEAMVCGTPVVANRRTGAAIELIEDGVNGFTVEQGDVDAYVARLEQLLVNHELHNAMSAAARNIVEWADAAYEAEHFLRAVTIARSRAGGALDFASSPSTGARARGGE